GFTDDVLDFLTTPAPPRRQHMDMQTQPDQSLMKFTAAFLEAARGDSEGRVSRVVFNQLRQQCGVVSISETLRKHGWVTGHASEGRTNIGWYKAGPKMTATQAAPQPNEPPEDPYARAKWLVAQKPG